MSAPASDTTVPLRVGHSDADLLTVPVVLGGHGQNFEPLAPEAVRGVLGTVRSSITSDRGHVREIPIETPELEDAEIAALEAMLGGGERLWAVGWLVDGGPVRVVPSPPVRRWPTPVQMYSSLEFTLRQASPTLTGV